MGYFSNAHHQAMFAAEWCDHCTHGQTECPVMALHLLWNGEQFPEHEPQDAAAAKGIALDLLISDETGCRMFHQRAKGGA